MIEDGGNFTNIGTAGNKKSDLVEWMLKDWTPKLKVRLEKESLTALKEGKTTITAKVGTTELKCNVTVSGKLGDIDKDGKITSFDAYKALKTSVDSLIGTEIDEQTQLTLDVNKNQKLESEDAYEILKYSVGLINEF